MKKIKAVIIDDEILAIEEMKYLLEEFSEINILATAQNIKEAIHIISTYKPDLIFLDIEMPDGTGFELLELLPTVPEVIFVTAYDRYALKAFDVNALAYLLKPVQPEKLHKVIDLAYKNIIQNSVPQTENILQQNSKFFIKDGEKCFFAPIHEIYLLESVGNYVKVFFKDEQPLLHKSLNQLEENLPVSLFFRANRQQIINLSYIQQVVPSFKNALTIYLQKGQKIELSIRQSIKFRILMSL